MLKRLRSHAFSKIAVYGLSTGIAAVLILAQTRVLWGCLSPADFGAWALIDPMLLPVASLVLFGIDLGIVKQIRIDNLSLRAVTGTLLVTTLPFSLLCLLAIGFGFHLAFHAAWTLPLLTTVAGEALLLMMQTAFRATGAVGWFSVLLVGRNIAYLAVLFVVPRLLATGPLPIGAVFLARGGCVLLVGAVAIAAMRPLPRIDFGRYRDAVRYGSPLLMTGVLYAANDMTDRWFLGEFTGVVAVGTYALHLKLAAILLQAIVMPFGLWFPPERFKRMNDADGGRRFFIVTASALAVTCGYLSGCVWLARDLLLPLIAPGLVPSPLALAGCLGSVTCLAMSHALNVGLLTPGHTGKNIVCTLYAVGATVLSGLVLVPLFGMNGAAATRLFGGLVLVAGTAAWSDRIFPIAFPFGAMALYFLAAAAAAFGIDRGAAGHGLAGVIAALAAWTAITGLLVLLSRVRLHPTVRQPGLADRLARCPAADKDGAPDQPRIAGYP